MSHNQDSQGIHGVTLGETLPESARTPDNVQLMLYNAALWNGHRIHFDEPYAKDVEGYPGLVIAGPLLGDWLNQCVEEWIGDRGRLFSIEYSNRLATYIGETLVVGGTVTAIDNNEATVELYIHNAEGANVAPGVAIVKLGVS